jgi:hypothetical protein
MKRLLPLMLAVMFAPTATLAQDAATSAQVKRGEYLVTTGSATIATRLWSWGRTARRRT